MRANEQLNDLGFKSEVKPDNLVSVLDNRATAEVQASYVIAKKFPRNEHAAYLRIMDACKRPFLAEQAMYAYQRGNKLVEGPSIRLAEVLAQSWGNLDCGVREVSQGNRVSTAEAYAVDFETNIRISKIFHVPHIRETKKGAIELTSPRDIYELVANQGARRLRACILAVLPGDLVEAAVSQCKKTLMSNDVPLVDQVRKMTEVFKNDFGVSVEHLEKRLGHKLDAIVPHEIVQLKAIYKSMRDGMASREDFFDIKGVGSNNEAAKEIAEILAEKNKHTNQKENKIHEHSG